VAAGVAEAHPVRPDSEWVTVTLRDEADVARALDLLRRSYELALARRAREQWEDVVHVVGGGAIQAPEFF
jgi:hypothetical protein